MTGSQENPPLPARWRGALAAPAPAPAPAGERSVPPLRDKTLVIRLTADERWEWHTAAAAAGRGKTAAWVRDLVSGLIASSRSAGEFLDVGRDERDRWRREFSRVGNNLNQLTRAVHVAEQNGTAVGFEIAGELRRVGDEMRRLRQAVEAELP